MDVRLDGRRTVVSDVAPLNADAGMARTDVQALRSTSVRVVVSSNALAGRAVSVAGNTTCVAPIFAKSPAPNVARPAGSTNPDPNALHPTKLLAFRCVTAVALRSRDVSALQFSNAPAPMVANDSGTTNVVIAVPLNAFAPMDVRGLSAMGSKHRLADDKALNPDRKFAGILATEPSSDISREVKAASAPDRLTFARSVMLLGRARDVTAVPPNTFVQLNAVKVFGSVTVASAVHPEKVSEGITVFVTPARFAVVSDVLFAKTDVPRMRGIMLLEIS